MSTEQRNKVAIFGGTFDPPHQGHLGAAKTALDSKLVDEVWFVPCFTHRFGKAPTRFEHRIAMCELLVAKVKGLSVCPIEKELNTPGQTLALVRALYARYPHFRFWLLVGTDIYYERERWHSWDEIAKLAPPIYVRRQGVKPIPELTLPAPKEISSTDLRNKLALGQNPDNEIPGPVLDYIRAHHLYRN